MHFKLILCFVDDNKSEQVLDAARKAGATGATIINNARGEGLTKSKSFLGMSMAMQCEVLIFLVEEHLSCHILEEINQAGQFDAKPGTGIAVQIDVEDAVGVLHQIETLNDKIEDEL